MTDTPVAAALIPGLPHLLAERPAKSWRTLATAVKDVGDRFRAAGAETVMVMSTQWVTVLGHQFQLDPRPKGRHHDENWYMYDFGKLPYEIPTDPTLTSNWSDEVAAGGLQSRNVRFDHYPIDTGTIVASKLLRIGADLPASMVSCNLYAAPDVMKQICAAGVAAARQTKRKVAILAVSGLSSSPIQRWIKPEQDRFENPEHDKWNTKILDLLAAGKNDEVNGLQDDFTHHAQVDAQFRGFSFLNGSGLLSDPGQVLAYGPIWGTGGAVVYWNNAA